MELNDQNFKQEVEDFKGIVLVDFFAEWCGPCKMMLPIIGELEAEYKNNDEVKVGKLDTDQAKETAGKFEIMGVPTFMVFKEGKNVEQVSGIQSKEALEELINKHK